MMNHILLLVSYYLFSFFVIEFKYNLDLEDKIFKDVGGQLAMSRACTGWKTHYLLLGF